jgi:RHS repeat-associated protein
MLYELTNQLTYRGYFYDFETGLYYLQSRYYAPNWGRFINADKHFDTGTGLLGTNLYIYCDDNPIMKTDPTGEAATNQKYTSYGITFHVETKSKIKIYTNNDNSGDSLKVGKGKSLKIIGSNAGKFYVDCGDKKYFVNKSDTQPAYMIADGVYFIKNDSSNKYMFVSSTANGTQVRQNALTYTQANERWKIEKRKDGYYSIAPATETSHVVSDTYSGSTHTEKLDTYSESLWGQKWLITSDGHILYYTVFNSGVTSVNGLATASTSNNAALKLTTNGEAWTFRSEADVNSEQDYDLRDKAFAAAEKHSKWNSANVAARKTLLTAYLKKVQGVLNTAANATITWEEKAEGLWGEYDYTTNKISLTTRYLAYNDVDTYAKYIEVIMHETRHCYQYEAVNDMRNHFVDPGTKEAWSKNIDNYISSSPNYNKYQAQPLEWDAFNFGFRRPDVKPVYVGSWWY